MLIKRILENIYLLVHSRSLLFISLIVLHASCKKFVEVPPPSQTITENAVYSSEAPAISVLTSLYNAMNSGPFQGGETSGNISLFTGLSADEYTLSGSITHNTYLSYYRNNLSQADLLVSGSEFWVPIYNFIFRCNAAIEGVTASNTLNSVVKEQLLGEAKFMRAFFYFYLINLFGDVPLVLTTDPEVNTLLTRSGTEVVYEQIIIDLRDAVSLMNDNYLDATLLNITTERTRPNKWVAMALLARAYLYMGDYINAEEQSTAVINNSVLFGLLPLLNNVFLKNSREAIWQIQPTALNFNTPEARILVIPPTGPSTGNSVNNPVYLSRHLLNSFEKNDKRVVYGNWVDTTIYKISASKNDTVAYSNKYKLNNIDPAINATTGTTNMKEYFMVLRLGEQYLIRAEARAQLGNITGAQNDLNIIRERAGLNQILPGDKEALLSALLHERQVELFSEWGHRWFDIKRLKKADEVMSKVTPLKANGAPWRTYQQLYPLPMTELQTAPNLQQNPNY